MLYLHPTTNIADAAIHAYDHGARLVTKAGRVAVVQGRDYKQVEKAKKVKALQAIASALSNGHTINPSI